MNKKEITHLSDQYINGVPKYDSKFAIQGTCTYIPTSLN
jgi:hypothetical protein